MYLSYIIPIPTCISTQVNKILLLNNYTADKYTVKYCKKYRKIQKESIQGTCRLSLKMGRGDEQKPLMHCIRR